MRAGLGQDFGVVCRLVAAHLAVHELILASGWCLLRPHAPERCGDDNHPGDNGEWYGVPIDSVHECRSIRISLLILRIAGKKMMKDGSLAVSLFGVASFVCRIRVKLSGHAAFGANAIGWKPLRGRGVSCCWSGARSGHGRLPRADPVVQALPRSDRR